MSFLKIRGPKKGDLIVDEFLAMKKNIQMVSYRNVSGTSVHNENYQSFSNPSRNLNTERYKRDSSERD